MASPAQTPTHLSDLEALLWTLDADPHLSSTFANVSFLDRTPDVDRLRRRLAAATRSVPLLARRVRNEPGPLPPRWEPVEHLDMSHHVEVITAAPGTTRQGVLQMAADIAKAPFDRDRPLWQFTVIDGLEDGTAAMVQKLHHTITDGEGGIRMSLAFVDLERDPPKRATDDEPDGPATHGAAPTIPSPLGVIGELARRGVDAAGSAAVEVGETVSALMRDPAGLAAALAALPAEGAGTVRSLIRQLGVTDRARSPIWTERSLHRELHTFSVPLEAVRETGHRLGVSVNDVFVAAASGGAGTYHRNRGAEVDDLRISMPVSTRTKGSTAGNAFTPTRVLVPLDADPRSRLLETHQRLGVAKTERSIGITGPLTALAALVPPPVLIRLARQGVSTVDFAASNVRAAPFDLFIAGALMESNHPVGPLGGTAWNITTMSYRGELDIGVHIDSVAVGKPNELVAAIEASFEELIALR